MFDWRPLSRPELGLADAISDKIASSNLITKIGVNALRSSPTLFVFSDYGGSHKGARYEVFSFLVSKSDAIKPFDAARLNVRRGSLGFERRMSYKALNDRVRMHSLQAFLQVVNDLEGVLVNFAVDKPALKRLGEDHKPEAAFGPLQPWANRSFRKLSLIANLAGILIEGIRRDGQDLLWITDEDEIAPNDVKLAEATKIVGHFLSHYCSGPMGHLRFGTTASDNGDLLIEDLAAVPDIAAGCIGDVLSVLASNPTSSSVERPFVPPGGGGASPKAFAVARWLANSSGSLSKLTLVIDEHRSECSIRTFQIVTNLDEL